MGLAFFTLSYVTLIPPLDGFILNYKKLDEWKEQKHFRVQLEAQRIFEQQLQQEQNLVRTISTHQPNHHTVHSHISIGSPKPARPSTSSNSESTHFAGAGTSVMTSAAAGVGSLLTMFSPPISPTKRFLSHPPLAAILQKTCNQEPQLFPHHQLQSKLQKSTGNFSSLSYTVNEMAGKEHSAVGKGKGRCTQEQALNDEQMKALAFQHEEDLQQTQKERQKPLRLDKSLPPIVTTGLEGIHQLNIPATFMLSPPPTRRANAVQSDPDSPLQYLCVGNDDPIEPTNSVPEVTSGGKMEWKGDDDEDHENIGLSDGHILRSAPHCYKRAENQTQQKPQYQEQSKSDQQQQQQQQPQHLPLRTTNKPAPPHDPFRKSSLSSKSTGVNVPSAVYSNIAKTSLIDKNKAHHSLYQPPEPPQHSENRVRSTTHPYQGSYYNPDRGTRPVRGIMEALPLTATGRILSSIGGMSGCYGIAGGVPGSTITTASEAIRQDLYGHLGGYSRPVATPEEGYYDSVELGCTRTNPLADSNKAERTMMHMSTATPSTHYEHQQEQAPASTHYMPDIVLTLPTPAETGSSRREGYFAI
ncbi:hypothetical protein BGX28_001868 [Mortierella sp. GBA30]|nr:hypothetical protein BGX28_001868 [Mortierella sp. GBA30]